MELKDFFDSGIEKTGSLTALGLRLGISQPHMSRMKAGKLAMPTEKCVLLADLIGADRFQVIASAKLAAAKDDDKKTFWRDAIGHAREAALIAIMVGVTNLLKPSPAQAAPAQEAQPARFVLCKVAMRHALRAGRRKKVKLHRSIQVFVETLQTMIETWIYKVQAV